MDEEKVVRGCGGGEGCEGGVEEEKVVRGVWTRRRL